MMGSPKSNQGLDKIVLDMGLLRSSPNQHNAWFNSSRKKTDHMNVRVDVPSEGNSRPRIWFDSEPAIGNAVPRSEVMSVDMLKAQDELATELGDVSAMAFSRESSQPPNSEEVSNSFSKAECTSTNEASINEFSTALCTAGRTLCARDTLPIGISTRGAEQRGENTIFRATPAYKRVRAICDVDGPRTSHLSSKKTVHQTNLVRKAKILNRVRLNIQQTAVTHGHDRVWRMTRLAAMSHGVQLVTHGTGAMFPGRVEEQVPGPMVPRVWRPYTTAAVSVISSISVSNTQSKGPDGSEQKFQPESTIHFSTLLPPTSIMTPLAGADKDEPSFPNADLDSRYADTSDDDADGVYADFDVLFGARADSTDVAEEDERCYEAYLNEVDRFICSS